MYVSVVLFILPTAIEKKRMILKFNLRWFYSRYLNPANNATAEENMYLCNWALDWNPPWESIWQPSLCDNKPPISSTYIFFLSRDVFKDND